MHEKINVTANRYDCYLFHRVHFSYTGYGVPDEK